MTDWLHRAAADGMVAPQGGQASPQGDAGLDVDQQQIAQQQQNPEAKKQMTLDELISNAKGGQEIGQIVNWLFQIGEAKAIIPQVIKQLDERLKAANVSAGQVKDLQPLVDAIMRDVNYKV